MWRWNLWMLVCLLTVVSVRANNFRQLVAEEEKISKYWERQGQKTLLSALRQPKIEKVAKNVILFLGDGMGVTTVTAMRIYKGQKQNRSGEDELLAFDQFPFVSLSKTYSVDRQTSDSASTATAYLCGVKANYNTLGLDGRVLMDDCATSQDASTHVPSIAKWAQDAGKSTGVVTTTRVTHATPAGVYAHSASRNWESVSPDQKCKDIAAQLIDDKPGKDLNVILGGGIREFIRVNEMDADGVPGKRVDNRNLLAEWLEDKQARNLKAKTVLNVDQLRNVNVEETDYLLGLFNSDHIPYVADRPELPKEYPSLKELTETAIGILSKNPEGYFLLVEGGHIDLAHHMNWAMKALEEGVEFDKAIQRAVELTNVEDTLIVVTADHSHTFTLGGDYPQRGTNILGIGGVSDMDFKTFTTLGYSSGPSYDKSSRDKNLTDEEVLLKDHRMDSTFPMVYETHGGEDVAVYARGPMAHLYHGVHDQTYIPYVMGYASCIGPNKDHCTSSALAQSTLQWAPVRFLAFGIWTYVFSSKLYF